MRRLIASSVAVAIVSWVTLGAGAGFVGLSRSVAEGPATLVTERPIVVVLVLFASALTAGLLTRGGDARPADAAVIAVVVVALDFIVALAVVPFAVGELGVDDAPLVTVVLAVLGFQPFGAFLGVLVGRVVSKRLDERQRPASS